MGGITLLISIHSPHARGDAGHAAFDAECRAFQSTPLMRGETLTSACCSMHRLNFNPLPSCEGRLAGIQKINRRSAFQSTPLMRGETICCKNFSSAILISIHSPHARGDKEDAVDEQPAVISIHSPHARGDAEWLNPSQRQGFHFNPLPSCEGRRRSTVDESGGTDFNPLPSCEGRRLRFRRMSRYGNFNPLPSCEGRRYPDQQNTANHRDFNPLPSCEGRRASTLTRRCGRRYFNPLPSCEGRPSDTDF